MNDEIVEFISTFSVKIAIPCMLAQNAMTNFTWELLRNAKWWLLLPFVLSILLYLLAYILTKIFRVGESEEGVFCALFAMPNTLTMGIPIVMSVSGEEGMTYLMAYYVATTIFFWGFVVGGIAKDAGKADKGIFEMLKRLFSAPMLSFFLGAAISLLSVSIPVFVVTATKYLGDMATPLALLMAGSILAKMGTEALRLDKTEILISIGRLIVCPVICLISCVALSVPIQISRVYVVMSGLPTMNQVMMMSRYYSANEQRATKMLMATTLLCLLSIPIIVMVFDIIYN